MSKHELKLRLDKYIFGVLEIEYLGYLISSCAIQPSQEHVKVILEYPLPKSAKQVQQFLGLVGFVRRFIPNFALISKPSYELLKKGTEFVFEEKEMRAFETLLDYFTTEPVLAVYSPTLYTDLHTEANALGSGAILLQRHRVRKQISELRAFNEIK